MTEPSGTQSRARRRARRAADPASTPPPARGDAGEDPAADWARIRASQPGPGHDWPRYADTSGNEERDRAATGAEAPPHAGPPSIGALLMLLEAARAAVPRELEQQLTALVRELLLTLRAVIDWYLERLDGSRGERRVEDIPID